MRNIFKTIFFFYGEISAEYYLDHTVRNSDLMIIQTCMYTR